MKVEILPSIRASNQCKIYMYVRTRRKDGKITPQFLKENC